MSMSSAAPARRRSAATQPSAASAAASRKAARSAMTSADSIGRPPVTKLRSSCEPQRPSTLPQKNPVRSSQPSSEARIASPAASRRSASSAMSRMYSLASE